VLDAELMGCTQPVASEAVQLGDLIARVRENHPALVGRGLPRLIPAVDQLRSGCLARIGGVDVTSHLIGADRLVRAACGELARGNALPVLALPPDGGDLDATVTLRDRAEGSTRLNRLQLFGIADQHQLGVCLFDLTNDPLHLARADHAGLVDDKDIARGEQLAPLPPLMLHAGDRARHDARSALQILGRNAGERETGDAVAGRLPGLARKPSIADLPVLA
jgi:hypothetical protein